MKYARRRRREFGATVDHTITNVETDEEITEEEKAALRALLADPAMRIEFAPGVREEMEAVGVSVEEVLEAMKKGASNKLV